MLDIRLHVEFEYSLGAGHGLIVDVDPGLAGLGDGAAVRVVENDREEPDLRAVGVEDVAEGRRDDGLEAKLPERPWRVLAGGAAAEVPSGDEDRVRLELDLAVADPVVEEELAEAAPLDPFQKLLGDDLVGVDVR